MSVASSDVSDGLVMVQDKSEYKARMNELLVLEPERTAVLTVDMQRDYLDGDVATSPLREDIARRVLDSTSHLLEAARLNGLPVVHCHVCRRAVEIEKGYGGTRLRKSSDRVGLAQNAMGRIRDRVDRLAGSAQAEIPAALDHPGDIHVSTKKTMDSFFGTDLEQILRRVLCVDTVVLTGINTETCVYSTGFSAANRDYRPVIVSDCVASTRGEDNTWMALELMSRTFAWVLTSAQLVAKLDAGASSHPAPRP